MTAGLGLPMAMPARAWQDPTLRAALSARDIGSVLRGVQKHTGASQARIAAAIGATQGRVSELIQGRRIVTTLDMFDRIADGLEMPDDARMLLGLAPVHPAGLDHLGASGRAEILAVYPAQSAARQEIQQRAAEASQIGLLAVRGLGLIGMTDSLLRSRIAARAIAVRVMLLDPDSGAARRRAAEIGESYGRFAAGIRLSIESLRDLAEGGADLQCHLYDSLPTWRVINLDSLLFVSAFSDGQEGHASPMYKLSSSPHGVLHRGLLRVISELHTTAQQIV